VGGPGFTCLATAGCRQAIRRNCLGAIEGIGDKRISLPSCAQWRPQLLAAVRWAFAALTLSGGCVVRPAQVVLRRLRAPHKRAICWSGGTGYSPPCSGSSSLVGCRAGEGVAGSRRRVWYVRSQRCQDWHLSELISYKLFPQTGRSCYDAAGLASCQGLCRLSSIEILKLRFDSADF